MQTARMLSIKSYLELPFDRGRDRYLQLEDCLQLERLESVLDPVSRLSCLLVELEGVVAERRPLLDHPTLITFA